MMGIKDFRLITYFIDMDGKTIIYILIFDRYIWKFILSVLIAVAVLILVRYFVHMGIDNISCQE